MPFRGISLEPIHKNIQVRLEELKRAHSYAIDDTKKITPGGTEYTIKGTAKYDPNAHLNLSKKTVWYSLRSNSTYFNVNDKQVSPNFSRLGPYWDNSTFKKGFPSWEYRTARPDFNNTPPPGVESISITTKGSMGSIKTADIKLKIFHPDDLEHIEYGYLMPGITLFLEWGWSGQTPMQQDLYDSYKGTSSKYLEEAIIKKKLGLISSEPIIKANQTDQDDVDVIALKPGQYDGMLGVITKFNWSLDTDGGYTATISIISPNSLVMGIQLESSQLAATKNTGYTLENGVYIEATKRKGDEWISATSKVSISDGEFLTRWVSKKLDLEGKIPKQHLVDQSGASGKRNEEIHRLNKGIARHEEIKKSLNKKLTEIESNLIIYSQPATDVMTGTVLANQDPQKQKLKQEEAAKEEAQKRIATAEWEIEWREGEIKKIESTPIEVDKTTDAKNTDAIEPTETYGIAGETAGVVYFSSFGVDSIFRGTTYFEKDGKILGKKRKCKFLLADPDGKYTRNGDPVTYSWQSSAGDIHDKLSEGAVLAARGWIRKDGTDEPTEADYVSWRWIEDFLLTLCAPTENEKPVISLSSTFIGASGGEEKYYSNQCINHPCIMSMDPNVCILTDKQSDAHIERVKSILGDESDEGHFPTAEFDVLIKNEGRFFTNDIQESEITQFGNYSSGNIRDILVNTKHLISVFKSQRSFEGFVTTLLADINDACGNPWDFTLQANESDSHVLQVVDKNYVMGSTTDASPLNPYLDGAKSLSAKKEEQLEPSTFTKHYRFKGIGSGNILKTVSMASKLPKAVASMAFISNKNLSANTADKNANAFNIYGDQVIDDFYSGNLGAVKKSPEKLAEEFIEKKKNLFSNWGTTFKDLFIHNKEQGGTLSPRQTQKQIVNTLVFGSKLHLKDKMQKEAVTSPRLLPLELTLTLDGISGIYQGNSLTMDVVADGGVLPNRYKDKVVFQITKVSNGISDSGWQTTLTCMMRMIPLEERKGILGEEYTTSLEGPEKNEIKVEVGLKTHHWDTFEPTAPKSPY